MIIINNPRLALIRIRKHLKNISKVVFVGVGSDVAAFVQLLLSWFDFIIIQSGAIGHQAECALEQ